MPLRHDISKADYKIKASEVKAVELVVVKQLLSDIDQSVQRASNPRLVENGSCWRHDKIALLPAPGQRNIGCPVKRRAHRDGERLILLDPLENLLLAEIGVARRGHDMATFDSAWRHGGRSKGRRGLFERQLRLVR